MPNQKLLLTGATGAFGSYLLRSMIKQTNLQLVLLVRAESDQAAALRVGGWTKSHPEIAIWAGDLAKPDLGLTPERYESLRDSLTDILHAAASTRFDLNLEQARSNNVLPTDNLIALARSAKNFNHFGLISTAFVAGQATGIVQEAPLTRPAGFVNNYDRTKAEAEQKLLEANLNAVIYRPSLVVAADSNNYHAAVVVLNLIRRGVLKALPGQPGDQIDLIAAPDAADAIVRLFQNHFEPGAVHHLAAGPVAPTLAELVALVGQIGYTGSNLDLFKEATAAARRNYPALAKIDSFIPYLAYPKQFATDRTIAAIGEFAKTDPIKILMPLLQ